LVISKFAFCGMAYEMVDTTTNSLFASYSRNEFNGNPGCTESAKAEQHEDGHNLKQGHQAGDCPVVDPAYPDACGFQKETDGIDVSGFSTIMVAYGCRYYCPTIDYWSNPDVTRNGQAVGGPDANSARSLPLALGVTADFKPTMVPLGATHVAGKVLFDGKVVEGASVYGVGAETAEDTTDNQGVFNDAYTTTGVVRGEVFRSGQECIGSATVDTTAGPVETVIYVSADSCEDLTGGGGNLIYLPLILNAPNVSVTGFSPSVEQEDARKYQLPIPAELALPD